MRTIFWTLLLWLVAVTPAHAQIRFRDKVDLDRVNQRLHGHVVDHTHNHGADRRIFSPSLGKPRDVYIYLPPGYDPTRFAYPLLVYLHMSFVDEHTFVGSHRIDELDQMIATGEFPATVVVIPDGTFRGENRSDAVHSLFINGCDGRFQDYLVNDLLAFVTSHYAIRPERQAHALMGVSAGGFGAMNLALKRRDLFATVATVASPLNLRYDTTRPVHGYFGNFNPDTFRFSNQYDPDAVVGRYYLGLSKTHASKYMGPVFGCEPDVAAAIRRENPADLLTTTGLRPGELNIYVGYPACDNFNFDAQAESFAWLAARRGVPVTLQPVPLARHSLPYFIHNHIPAYRWLAPHLWPPAPLAPVRP